MKTKSYMLQPTKANVKAIGEGKVTAVFATMNVVDKDGDVTLPGAFGRQRVKIVGAHDWSMPALGFADIYEVGDEAIAEMTFYLDTPKAAEWFAALKHNFDNEVFDDYSYGFNIEEASFGTFGEEKRNVRFIKKTKVFEVSPVMVGAGVNTRTLSAKAFSQGAFCLETAQRAILKRAAELHPESVVGLESTFEDSCVIGLYKSTNDVSVEFVEFEWKLQPDGTAVLRNKHRLDEPITGSDPASLKEAWDALKFRVLAHAALTLPRVAPAAADSKQGRVLSRANRDRLGRLLTSISNAASDIDALLAETMDEDDEGKQHAVRVFGQYQQTLARLHGHIQ